MMSALSAMPLAAAPELHLLVNGARLEGRRMARELYAFDLPPGARSIHILSGEQQSGRIGLQRIVLWRGHQPSVITAGHAALREGFARTDNNGETIWALGDAVIPDAFLAGNTPVSALHLHLSEAS